MYDYSRKKSKFLISLKNRIYLFYKQNFFLKIVLNKYDLGPCVQIMWIVAVQKISRIGGDLKQT